MFNTNSDVQPFLYEVLREKLTEREISQSELAKRVGVSQPYMNQLTKGMRVPSVELVRKICRELGLELSDLIVDPGGE